MSLAEGAGWASPFEVGAGVLSLFPEVGCVSMLVGSGLTSPVGLTVPELECSDDAVDFDVALSDIELLEEVALKMQMKGMVRFVYPSW